MKHLAEELQALRDEVLDMWNLVYSQLDKSKRALLENNKDLAFEVISREKRVNAYELMIDSDCENYIALYSPVAIDLRLVLSLLKINGTLERIGDFAEGIARFALDTYNPRYKELIEDIQIEKLFDAVLEMLQGTRIALEKEDTQDAGHLFSQDDQVDDLYKQSLIKIADFIKANPDCALDCIYLAILDRKLERIGDHCNNIVEEIVFYIDAKVMKHCGLKKEEWIKGKE